jgi:hypothetical protein
MSPVRLCRMTACVPNADTDLSPSGRANLAPGLPKCATLSVAMPCPVPRGRHEATRGPQAPLPDRYVRGPHDRATNSQAKSATYLRTH